jgi:transcriptional regulator with XRE-family HTH domain
MLTPAPSLMVGTWVTGTALVTFCVAYVLLVGYQDGITGIEIAEELTLRDLRKAHEMTQEKLAEVLGVKQESISNLEKRSDMLLSTLRDYVAALGGELQLRVKFPDRPAVAIKSFSEAGTKA